MANSADPDLDLHCLQRQGISGFSRTRVKDQIGYSSENLADVQADLDLIFPSWNDL